MEIVKVYTKYDVIPNRIIRNEESPLASEEWGVLPWKPRCYDAVDIEEGLEGVRIVHYKAS